MPVLGSHVARASSLGEGLWEEPRAAWILLLVFLHQLVCVLCLNLSSGMCQTVSILMKVERLFDNFPHFFFTVLDQEQSETK